MEARGKPQSYTLKPYTKAHLREGVSIPEIYPWTGLSAFCNALVIHLISENGLTVAMTFPLMSPSGTGPKYLESRDATRLSPTIQQ